MLMSGRNKQKNNEAFMLILADNYHVIKYLKRHWQKKSKNSSIIENIGKSITIKI